MLPKMGRKIPAWTGVLGGRETYARTMAELLHQEHDDSHRAIKQLMRQTNACERTVKHWLSGQHGPDTVYFLRLVASSPVIRAFFLNLIEEYTTALVDQTILGRPLKASVTAGCSSATSARKTDPEGVPERDPVNVPDWAELNERQRWLLDRVAEGRCHAQQMAATWGVSLKTARRDIAALKEAGFICYVGSCRKGRYRRTSE